MKKLVVAFSLTLATVSSALAGCGVEKFDKLLTENLSREITCLQTKTLELLELTGATTVSGLERALELKPDAETDGRTLAVISAISDLNHLIRGDAKDSLNPESIVRTLGVLKVLNRESAMNHAPLYQNESPASPGLHKVHANRLQDSTNTILVALKAGFVHTNEKRAVDLPQLLSKLTGSTNLLPSLMYKRMFLGGSIATLTDKEVELAIDFAAPAVEATFGQQRLLYLQLDGEAHARFVKRIDELLDSIFVTVRRLAGK